MDKGDYIKAIADFTELTRLYPKRAEGYALRALAYAGEFEVDKASADVAEANRLDPQLGNTLAARGQKYGEDYECRRALWAYKLALRLKPDDWDTKNSIAWILATCPDAKLRDGETAVWHAKKACELTNWKDARCVDTLAAAQAECGRFDEAVKWQKQALDLAPESQKLDFQTRLELYEHGKPYRLPAR
jgi:Flp pilus assembly protein TadD